MCAPFKRIIVGLTFASSLWSPFAARAQRGALEDRPYEPSPSVIKGTIAALRDGSEDVVCLAIRNLGDWRQADAAAEVEKLLEATVAPLVRVQALQFFARLGPDAKPHLAAVLKHRSDGDPNIRALVLDVVHQAKASADHVPVIAPLLEDNRADVRMAAARCLAQAGRAASDQRKTLLGAIAATGSAAFKAEALRALAQIGGLTGADIDVLLPLIRDREGEVRIGAWSAILHAIAQGRSTGTITLEELASYRVKLVPAYEKEPPEVQAALIEDIRRDKTTAAFFMERVLQKLREGSPEIKAVSLRTLGNGGEAALAHLELIAGYAKDPDSVVRAAAVAALGSLGTAAVKPQVAVVANALLDPSETVREEALQALPKAGDALGNLPFRIRDAFETASPGARATLIKAAPAICRVIGVDADIQARARAALRDPDPEVRIATCYVMDELGPTLGTPMLPDLLALVSDPEASVRGAAIIALRSYAIDAETRKKFRAALRPLLKDKDTDVRWAVLDTFHELDPAQEPEIVAEIASLLKDEEQAVRNAAVRALGAARAAARPHLAGIVAFFGDDPAVPPYAAAQAVSEISPLSAQELASLLSMIYVYADFTPLIRVTAYAASAGEGDGLLVARLIGRSRNGINDVVPAAERARARALLVDCEKAPLLHDKLKAEIQSRVAELK